MQVKCYFCEVVVHNGMPATKLIKILKALMRQNTKIRGLKDILMWAIALATITMPATLWSQPVPEENEWVVVIDARARRERPRCCRCHIKGKEHKPGGGAEGRQIH